MRNLVGVSQKPIPYRYYFPFTNCPNDKDTVPRETQEEEQFAWRFVSVIRDSLRDRK